MSKFRKKPVEIDGDLYLPTLEGRIAQQPFLRSRAWPPAAFGSPQSLCVTLRDAEAAVAAARSETAAEIARLLRDEGANHVRVEWLTAVRVVGDVADLIERRYGCGA